MSEESMNRIELEVFTANVSNNVIIDTPVEIEQYRNDVNIENAVESANLMNQNPDQNHFLIHTIIENDDDSSIIESDSEADGVHAIAMNNNVNQIPDFSPIWTKNGVKPSIGSVGLQNSPYAMIGDKTIYRGPVTIQQFVKNENDGTVKGSCLSKKRALLIGVPFCLIITLLLISYMLAMKHSNDFVLERSSGLNPKFIESTTRMVIVSPTQIVTDSPSELLNVQPSETSIAPPETKLIVPQKTLIVPQKTLIVPETGIQTINLSEMCTYNVCKGNIPGICFRYCTLFNNGPLKHCIRA